MKPFAAAKLEIELLVTPCPTPSQLLLNTIESRTNKCLQRSFVDAHSRLRDCPDKLRNDRWCLMGSLALQRESTRPEHA